MNSRSYRIGQYWIISCEGRIEGQIFGAFPGVFQAIRQGAKNLLLDLSGIDEMNSMGIRALQVSVRMALQREVNLSVVSPHKEVQRALKSSAMAQGVALYQNPREASIKLSLPDLSGGAQGPLDRIIVCENEIPIRKFIRKSIDRNPVRPGFRLIKTDNLIDARRKAGEEERIGALIIDASFPLEDIIIFLNNLRNDPVTTKIPIITVANDSQLENAELVISSRVNAVTSYPADLKEIGACIHIVISRTGGRCDSCRRCQFAGRPWLLEAYGGEISASG